MYIHLCIYLLFKLILFYFFLHSFIIGLLLFLCIGSCWKFRECSWSLNWHSTGPCTPLSSALLSDRHNRSQLTEFLYRCKTQSLHTPGCWPSQYKKHQVTTVNLIASLGKFKEIYAKALTLNCTVDTMQISVCQNTVVSVDFVTIVLPPLLLFYKLFIYPQV